MTQVTLVLVFASVLLVRHMALRADAFLDQQTNTATATSRLNYEFFRDRVQPIFLNQREGSARCYTCHAQRAAGTFRLQLLSPGTTSWNEEQSRLNFEATAALVVPGDLLKSPLLKHPLAAEAGGDLWHGGGQQFASQDDPEWKILAAWASGGDGATK